MSALDVFRATTEEMIDHLAHGGDKEAATILGSTPLQERLTMGWEDEAEALAAVIGATAGAADDDDVVLAVLGPRSCGPTARSSVPR